MPENIKNPQETIHQGISTTVLRVEDNTYFVITPFGAAFKVHKIGLDWRIEKQHEIEINILVYGRDPIHVSLSRNEASG